MRPCTRLLKSRELSNFRKRQACGGARGAWGALLADFVTLGCRYGRASRSHVWLAGHGIVTDVAPLPMMTAHPDMVQTGPHGQLPWSLGTCPVSDECSEQITASVSGVRDCNHEIVTRPEKAICSATA